MPIRKSQRHRYPKNWRLISERIRFDRAGGKCECTGQCGAEHEALYGQRCGALHGKHVLRHRTEPWRWVTGDEFDQWEVRGIQPDEWADKSIKIILTTAHLDQTPEHCEDSNLLAMCQFCHLRMDRDQRTRTARETRRSHRAVGDLFDENC